MAFEIPDHLIVKEAGHWIINHRMGANLPGYLMIGSRVDTTNLFDLSSAAQSELGVLLAQTQQALSELFQPEHIYIGRYGHTKGHSIHFHVIPIYAWVKDAFLADDQYRVLRSFYTPGVSTSDPDGSELTLYVWRELCESKNPPPIHGPTVESVISLLKEKLA